MSEAKRRFPRQPDKDGGWTLEYEYLKMVSERAREIEGLSVSMETVEAVLLAAEDLNERSSR